MERLESYSNNTPKNTQLFSPTDRIAVHLANSEHNSLVIQPLSELRDSVRWDLAQKIDYLHEKSVSQGLFDYLVSEVIWGRWTNLESLVLDRFNGTYYYIDARNRGQFAISVSDLCAGNIAGDNRNIRETQQQIEWRLQYYRITAFANHRVHVSFNSEISCPWIFGNRDTA